MKSKKEINKKIDELKEIKRGVSPSVKSKYNLAISLLRWVME